MKREEKNALSRQRILDAAMEEFSGKGYEGASLNTVWEEKGLSKGIVYHYFKDRDELYLLCVERCFDALTAYMRDVAGKLNGPARERLQTYFDGRLRFFVENPLYLGLFADAVFHTPAVLSDQIALRRQSFDQLNISVLTELLKSEPMRKGLSPEAVAEDFRMYMDFFNLHFRSAIRSGQPVGEILMEHEKRCHRQLDILLYGVMEEKNEE